jgi:serine/threonine protein kinase
MGSLIFDKYEVLKRLAVGGMGEIFLARQHGVAGFDRLVILKSLLPDLADSNEAVDQFLDEARVAATLNHPNVVSIYEVGLWDGIYFIAMEYIEGENVGILMKAVREKKQRLPFSVAARIIHDAAVALDYAHHARSPSGQPLMVVHRDVSPQNIMVRIDGVTKVVDFGVAKAANRSTRTATGVIKGKIRYMPPEQINGGACDHRSDQFSLGVVFWEMLAGQRLFNKAEHDDVSTLRMMLREPIQPPSTVISTMPRELDAIVMRMLQRNPADRYARCRDAASELMRFLERHSAHLAEDEVIKIVGESVGQRIHDKTSDLTPSRENFFISLSERTEVSKSKEEATHRTQFQPPPAPLPVPEPKSRGLMIGAIVAGILLALSGGVMFGLSNTEPIPVQAIIPRAAETAAVDIVEPAGATVFVDNKKIEGRTPVRVDPLEPGAHVVRIELAGFQPTERKLTLRAGEALVLREQLSALPSLLKIESTPPGVTVRAGAIVLGSTPLEVTTLASGVRHELSFDRAEFQPATRIVELTPGETLSLNITLEAQVAPAKPRVRGPKPRPTDTTRVTDPPSVPVPVPVPVAASSEGFLSVRTTPWTKVTIAGAPHGATPLFKLRLHAGKHTVRLTNEQAGIDATRVVEIKGGETTKLDLQLTK